MRIIHQLPHFASKRSKAHQYRRDRLQALRFRIVERRRPIRFIERSSRYGQIDHDRPDHRQNDPKNNAP